MPQEVVPYPLGEIKRQCTRCKRVLPLRDFNWYTRGIVNYQRKTCGSCYAYYTDWSVRNRGRCNASARAWVSRNREKHNALYRCWASSPTGKEWIRQYNKSPKRKEMYALKDAKRRGLMRSERPLTVAEWEDIKTQHNNCCAYCGKPSQRLTQDHITPLSKGGAHSLHNVIPACRSCNSRKNVGPPLCQVQPLLLTAL